ncbi:hypothetical protein Q5P01_021344 [Channa striata]|uniref:Uncharacterized protein n=1 Tax=Channa striata TaxID=64152 RepID=A0AA88S973_CHASR|nr:hypothetical protein Q5P01_021344 [Channa striata]
MNRSGQFYGASLQKLPPHAINVRGWTLMEAEALSKSLDELNRETTLHLLLHRGNGIFGAALLRHLLHYLCVFVCLAIGQQTWRRTRVRELRD